MGKKKQNSRSEIKENVTLHIKCRKCKVLLEKLEGSDIFIGSLSKNLASNRKKLTDKGNGNFASKVQNNNQVESFAISNDSNCVNDEKRENVPETKACSEKEKITPKAANIAATKSKKKSLRLMDDGKSIETAITESKIEVKPEMITARRRSARLKTLNCKVNETNAKEVNSSATTQNDEATSKSKVKPKSIGTKKGNARFPPLSSEITETNAKEVDNSEIIMNNETANESKVKSKSLGIRRKERLKSTNYSETNETKTEKKSDAVVNKANKINDKIEGKFANIDDVYDFMELSQPNLSEDENISFFKKLQEKGKIRLENHRRHHQRHNAKNVKKNKVKPAEYWRKFKKEIMASSTTSKKQGKSKNEQKAVSKKQKGGDCALHENDTFTIAQDEPSSSTIKTTVQIHSPPNNESSIITLPAQSTSANVTAVKKSRRVMKDKEVLAKFAQNLFGKKQSQSSTPVANKKKPIENSTECFSPILPEKPNGDSKTPSSVIRQQLLQNDSVISNLGNSTTKNLSNAENIPPAAIENTQKTITRQQLGSNNNSAKSIDGNRFHSNSILQQQQKLQSKVQRNPLRQINVISDEQILPPLQHKTITKTLAKRRQSIFMDVNEIRSPKWPKTNDNDDAIYNTKENTDVTVKDNDNYSVQNSFGFEEFEEKEEENESNKTRSPILPKKSDVQSRLRNLKKLESKIGKGRGNDERMQQRTPAIFGESSKKQTLIREMLTSTMITTIPSTNQTAFDEETTLTDDCTNAVDNTTIDLFEDAFNPETTFNTTKVTKTYSRPKAKPKRKCLFFSDDNDQKDEKHRNKNHKKQNKEPTEGYDKEFEKFAEHFNSIIEEAESYEIPTEIDTTVVET